MSRKFYKNVHSSIQYQWGRKGLFSSTPSKRYQMMFYEENGKFFELLTGRCLGTRKYLGNTPYVFSNEFGFSIPLDGYSYYQCAQEVTIDAFASDAKRYMRDKEQIIPYLNEQFEKWKTAYKKTCEENKLKKANADWLTTLLDSRK